MTDTAHLQIRASSAGVTTATGQLERLERQGRKTERATDGIGASFGRLLPAAAVIGTIVAAGTKLVNVTREFESLRASLATAVGGADNATIAFEAIQDFATQTPYDLAQATEGFTKLVNLGLTPSERALRSYGNTASAMGKDLMQLVEAVADAATGEFERLKEFGIKAKNQGDTVAFTFRGVTKEVKNNASEIEEYLTQLGENEFAGQMEVQMQTLNGALSNFGDEWDKVFDNINQAGAGDIIKDAVRLGVDALQELNAMLASGQLEGYLDAIGSKFSGFGDDVADTMSFISDLWNEVPGEWREQATAAVDFIIDAFVNLPENMRATVQLMAVELASLIDYGKEFGAALIDVIVAKFDELVAKAEAYGTAIGEAINPFSDGDFNLDAELATIEGKYQAAADSAWQTARDNADRVAQVRRDSIGDIIQERDAAVESFDEQMNKATQLREEYEKTQAAKAAANEGVDRLAGFKVQPDESGGGTSGGGSKDFDKLVADLRSEEEVIAESYRKRVELIEANTEVESEQRRLLLEKVKEMRDADVEEMATKRMADVEAIRQSLLTEEEAIRESYERRKEIILENTQLTEEERLDLTTRLEQAYLNRTKELETKRTQQMVQGGEKLFGSLADLSKTFAGEQSGIYKAMFAASKAFAIADAIIKIQQGIAAAAATPWPANIAAIASTVAATAGVISTITSTSMELSGAYDKGGNIPAGKVGLVGEFGPELIKGPVNVTGREESLKKMTEGRGGVTINLINQAPGVEQVQQSRTDEEGNEVIDVITRQVKSELSAEVQEGGSSFTQALENSYPSLRRGAA